MSGSIHVRASFRRLATGVFLDYTSFGVVLTAILPVVELEEGGGPILATLIIAAPLLSQTLASYGWGWLSDRWGRRREPLVLGTSLQSLLFLLYPAVGPSALLVIRVVQAACFGTVVLATATGTEGTQGKAGERLGRLSVATNAGNAVGVLLAFPLLGGSEFVLTSATGWALTGLLASLGLASAALYAAAGELPPGRLERRDRPKPSPLRLGPGIALLSLATLTLSVGRWSGVTLVPIYLNQQIGRAGFFGLPLNVVQQLALFTLAASVASMAVSPWAGRLVEVGVRRRRMLWVLAASYAATWAIVAVFPVYPVVFIVWVIPLGVFATVAATREVAARSRPEDRATAVGLWTAAYNGGGLIGGVLTGSVVLASGTASQIFALSAGLSLGALVQFVRLPHSRASNGDDQRPPDASRGPEGFPPPG